MFQKFVLAIKCYEEMKALLLLTLCSAALHRANAAVIYGYEKNKAGVGGTEITIKGSGFSEDQFSYFHPHVGNKVYFDNYAKTRSCDVIRYKSSPERIVCRIQEYGLGVRTSWFTVYVYVDGVPASRGGWHWMQYRSLGHASDSFYYVINDISPKTGPPGTVVTLTGSFRNLFYEDNSEDPLENEGKLHVERLEFGGRSCKLQDNNGAFYGFSETEIICKTDDSAVGNFLIELEVESPIGVVVPNKEHFRLSSQNEIYNYQAYPLISSVTPAEGSDLGNSLMTITGVGLYNSGSETKVTVGGAECKLISGSNERLTCLTPAKSEISQEEYIPGGRGLLYELWDEFVPNLADDDALKTLFTTTPNVSEVVDRTEVPEQLYTNYIDHTARLSGYFNPPHDGEYGFHCRSAALKLYKRVNDSFMEKIEDIGYGYNYWRSSVDRLSLSTDETYTIEILHHSTTGRTKYPINIQLIDYDTKFTSLDVKRTSQEKQKINVHGSRRKEEQVINFDTLIPNVSPDLALRFVFGGQKSDPFTVGDIIQEDSAAIDVVQNRLWDMLGAKCTVSSGGSDVYIEDDFEDDPLVMKGKTNVYRHQEVEPYCGHYVGARGGGLQVYHFDNLDVRRHKWTCFAYMGKFYKFNMLINFYVKENGRNVAKREWVPLEERDWKQNIDR